MFSPRVDWREAKTISCMGLRIVKQNNICITYSYIILTLHVKYGDEYM